MVGMSVFTHADVFAAIARELAAADPVEAARLAELERRRAEFEQTQAGPRRIRMTRRAPWRAAAPSAVVVDRRTRWGNPFRVGGVHPVTGQVIADRAAAVAAFVAANGTRPVWLVAARVDLGGRDLACWCPLDEPCHADVLLCLANHETCRCWERGVRT